MTGVCQQHLRELKKTKVSKHCKLTERPKLNLSRIIYFYR